MYPSIVLSFMKILLNNIHINSDIICDNCALTKIMTNVNSVIMCAKSSCIILPNMLIVFFSYNNTEFSILKSMADLFFHLLFCKCNEY